MSFFPIEVYEKHIIPFLKLEDIRNLLLLNRRFFYKICEKRLKKEFEIKKWMYEHFFMLQNNYLIFLEYQKFKYGQNIPDVDEILEREYQKIPKNELIQMILHYKRLDHGQIILKAKQKIFWKECVFDLLEFCFEHTEHVLKEWEQKNEALDNKGNVGISGLLQRIVEKSRLRVNENLKHYQNQIQILEKFKHEIYFPYY